MTHPWEKPPEPDYNEIPDFLRRELPPNPANNPPAKDPIAPLPWEPTTSSHS